MPTGLKAVAHIYVGDKGDYYDVDDPLPQYLDAEHGVLTP